MKAILHIGFPKTGSTTIQKHLAGNRSELLKQSVFVPKYNILHESLEDLGLENAGHASLFYASSEPDGKDFVFASLMKLEGISKEKINRELLDSFWKNLREEILEERERKRVETVVLSCEVLAYSPDAQVKRLRELLGELFDEITVIVYLRRQMESLISWYAEVHKMGIPFPTFETLLTTQPDVAENYFFNYEMVLGIWSKYFGTENIKPRVFHRKEMVKNDLLDDFTETAGIENASLKRFDSVNHALSSEVIEFCRLLNKSYPLFTREGVVNPDRLVLAKILVEGFARSGNRGYHPGREQVREIIEIYRASNNNVARLFFNRDRLFDEDVSNYPEKTATHGLTPLKCTELSAYLWNRALHPGEETNEIAD